MKRFLKNNRRLLTGLTILCLLALYGYYFLTVKRNPYKLADFKSFSYEWGTADSLSAYDSATGDYRYFNRNDSLVKTNIKLRNPELIYMHNKMNELGFWELPDTLGSAAGAISHFSITFRYAERTKRLSVYGNYEGPYPRLDSALQIRRLIQQVIDDAGERYIPGN